MQRLPLPPGLPQGLSWFLLPSLLSLSISPSFPLAQMPPEGFFWMFAHGKLSVV